MRSITFVIGTLSNGGAERVVSILANEMQLMGYKVSIITLFSMKNSYLDNENIPIYGIKKSTKYLKNLNILRGLRKHFKEINPDVIISFDAQVNIYSLLSSLSMNKTIIVSERNDPYKYPESKTIRKVRDYLYKYADGVVFQTPYAMNYFSEKIRSKGRVIYNPVTNNLPHWNYSTDSKVIVTASRLVKQKNIPLLIKAFSIISEKYPDYKLKIYGIGPLKNELIRLVSEMNLNDKVLILGFSNKIHNEIASSSMFVISSDYEGISNSMLEALAIGVPVISTDPPTGGARLFIQNEINGILVDVGNLDNLVDAMNKILSDKEFAYKLSIEGKKIREKLSPRKIAEKWVDHAKQLYDRK